MPIARIAFLIAAPVCTEPEAHLLGHADFSMPANAQTEDPFRVTDQMPPAIRASVMGLARACTAPCYRT